MEKITGINRVSSAAGYKKNLLGWCVIALAASVLLAGMSFAASAMKSMVKPIPDFEKMESLVGEWQGKSADGTTAKVSYTLVSDNSALMEKLTMGGESEMVTIYHPDGDHMMMTHYCSAHNQPRMRSQAGFRGGKTIVFDLVDVTNLSSPDAGHMKKLAVTLVGQDRFTQEWTWSEKGKDGTVVIQFEKKK